MDDKRQEIQKWFDCLKPELPIRATAVALVLVLIGVLILNQGQAAVGSLCLLGGLAFGGTKAWLYSAARRRYLNRTSVDQVLRWLAEDFARLSETSMARFGVTPADLTRESIMVAGPVFWDEPGFDSEQTSRVSVADDPLGPYLYRCWKVCVIHFARGMLMLYRCGYDWCGDRTAGDSTEGIGYEHVVSVKTDVSAMQRMTHAGPLLGASKLVMSLSNQTQTDIPFGGSALRPVNETQLNAQADAAVQAIYSAKRDWTAASGRPLATAAAVAATAAGGRAVSGWTLGCCTNCGRQFQQSEAFCPVCGTARSS